MHQRTSLATLLCLAMALPLSAMAQSSVTLFGIVDAAITHGNGSGPAASSRTQLGSGANQLSRLGFHGQEDLGNGLRASFWLEGQLNTDNGTGGAGNTNNQASGAIAASGGFNFARRATVSLQAPAWGELRLGRDVTPQSLNTVLFDPFTNVGVGASLPFVLSRGGFTLLRASNTVGYFSPQWNGLSAQLQHYFGENPSGTATAKDGTGTGLRLAYTHGAFRGGLALSQTRYASGDIAMANLGGAYRLGDWQLLFTLNRDQVSGTGADGKGGLLGLTYTVGAGEIKTTWSRYETSAANHPRASKLALGYVHHLSKRTALYTTYARVQNQGGSQVALGNATTSPNAHASGFDLGIRHSF